MDETLTHCFGHVKLWWLALIDQSFVERRMSRSEHNLSDEETSPDLGSRRSNGNRFMRGVRNDIDDQSRRSRDGWNQFASTLKSWSSKGLATLKSLDWKGNGRLVSALSECSAYYSYFLLLDGRCNLLLSSWF
jgi:hypothetical protein